MQSFKNRMSTVIRRSSLGGDKGGVNSGSGSDSSRPPSPSPFRKSSDKSSRRKKTVSFGPVTSSTPPPAPATPEPSVKPENVEVLPRNTLEESAVFVSGQDGPAEAAKEPVQSASVAQEAIETTTYTIERSDSPPPMDGPTNTGSELPPVSAKVEQAEVEIPRLPSETSETDATAAEPAVSPQTPEQLPKPVVLTVGRITDEDVKRIGDAPELPPPALSSEAQLSPHASELPYLSSAPELSHEVHPDSVSKRSSIIK